MEKDKERIAKIIAHAGVCSRRDAERLIADGKVSVNGETLTSPAFLASADDKIIVNGKPLPKEKGTKLYCYHKPSGLVTTHKDPEGRPTVFEMLPKKLPRLISIGRLDLNSEGLLLLTNDGELARRLELPSNRWKRTYKVRIFGKIPDDMPEKLLQGVTIEGIHYAPAEVKILSGTQSNHWVEIVLQEGKNREIRRLMKFFGLEVSRLIRLSYGPFELGDLPRGVVKEIPAFQVSSLLSEQRTGVTKPSFSERKSERKSACKTERKYPKQSAGNSFSPKNTRRFKGKRCAS